MSNNIPTNSDDVIDSRDVIARIDDLESDRTALADDVAEAEEGTEAHTAAVAALAEWDASDEGDELTALKALADEAEGYAHDWQHGATLIRDSYFTEYAQELVSDIGDMPKEIPSYIVIDWEATAENIKADYTSVSFDGVDYWVR